MLNSQKDKFDLPEGISYLNVAYMSPLLKTVDEAGREAVSRKLRPYAISPTDFFNPVEELKAEYAKLIHADDAQRIALIPSVSYGIATVANNLKLESHQKIVVVEDQFPSNVYTWIDKAQEVGAQIDTIAAPSTIQQKGALWNQAILEAIDEHTALVALPHVHWSEGILFDLMAIRKKSRQFGALLVIDGTQSVGAYPFSVAEIQPDALICGGYKWLLGGYSLGLAYYGSAFDDGKPIEHNWINRKNSEDFTRLVDYEPEFKTKANRYNVGELSNFILVPMLHTAIKQLNEWGVDNIQKYCQELTAKYKPQLRELGFQFPENEQIAAHLFAIKIPDGISIDELRSLFQKEQLFVSFRGNNIRISTHLFNTTVDFDKLIRCLKQASALLQSS